MQRVLDASGGDIFRHKMKGFVNYHLSQFSGGTGGDADGRDMRWHPVLRKAGGVFLPHLMSENIPAGGSGVSGLCRCRP